MSRWTIQISAGAGPVEVRRFVALLAREMVNHCRQGGVAIATIIVVGDENAPKSVAIEVEGDAPSIMGCHLGTHVLVARSRDRGRHSRKRWFAGVSLHPASVPQDVAIKIHPSEIEVTATRAGGPGGQHVNTTDSAVRIRHKPSGISVRVASERSQHQNRSRALARLVAILTQKQQSRRDVSSRDRRLSHYRFTRGSAVREWTYDKRSSALFTT